MSAERELANFYGAEGALMFNSGYDANLGFFSAVPQRGDHVFYDEFIHASVRDGIRLGFAKHQSFFHNNVADLELKLQKSEGTVFVVVEGLYSMEGDLCPLLKICELCEKYNAHLIVDEAHSGGIYGKQGSGLVSALGLEAKICARIVTFGKAYGSHGACVLGSKTLMEFLINFSRPFIYSTALPPDSYKRNVQMVKFPLIDDRRKALQSILHYFRSSFDHPGLISERNSPIQIVQIDEVERIKEMVKHLQEAGIAIKPIYSPTVPKGMERLRICFHSFNTMQEVDELTRIISCG